MSAPTFTAEATVTGMSCGHCVASVTEEVETIPGVNHVAVDLPTGRLSLAGLAPIDPEAVRRAVTEAGFSLA